LYSKKCTKISNFTKKIYFPLFSAVLHHFQADFFAILYKKILPRHPSNDKGVNKEGSFKDG
jgi:hypothetical protein